MVPGLEDVDLASLGLMEAQHGVGVGLLLLQQMPGDRRCEGLLLVPQQGLGRQPHHIGWRR